MPLRILSGFLPWIVFYILYETAFDSMLNSSFFAAALVVIFSFKELKKGFVLPVGSLLLFLAFGLNAEFHLFGWVKDHAMLVLNSALAIIIWLSLLIGKPFTLQYARENIDRAYWHSPLFLKINWLLTIIWAVCLTIIALPTFFMSQAEYIGSWFWSYAFNAVFIVLALVLNYKLPGFLIGRNFWQTVAKLPTVNSPFLKGGYQPVKQEVTLNYLAVEGTLPADLQGRYLRNGPNPLFQPYTYTYPIDGDGMIHEISFNHGRVNYRNRFVKTKGLVAEQKAGKALFGGIKLPFMPDPKYVTGEVIKNTASVHVVEWDEDILALYEAAPAYLLGKDLNTVGEWHPTGEKFNVNAHHRVDPVSGHTYMFTYEVAHPGPYLKFYEFDQEKTLLKTVPITKAQPTMVHDFVITQNYIVVFDTPAIFNVDRKDNQPILSYEALSKVNILLIQRSTYSVTSITGIDSFFVYHFINAYEEANKIVVDFVHYGALELNPSVESTNPPRLYRGEIDLNSMSYQHKQLFDAVVEFPSYNLHYTGQKYRYAYLALKTTKDIEGFNALLKYDFDTNTPKIINFEDGVEVGEATFVAKANAEAEDQGYLILFVYHKQTDTSDCLILNAHDPAETLARIKLPVRIPHGLHGSWAAYK
jgi:carotenoid cleavage dioxygenase